MRNMERLFIAVLAIGIVGALSGPASTTGRTAAATNSAANNALKVSSHDAAVSISRKEDYDVERERAEGRINIAEASIAHLLKYDALKVTVNDSLKLAKIRLSEADEAAKMQSWSSAGSKLVDANFFTFLAEQRVKDLLDFQSEIVFLLSKLQNQNVNIDKMKAKTKLAENVVNAAMINLGKANSPDLSMLSNATRQVEIVAVRFMDGNGKFVTFY